MKTKECKHELEETYIEHEGENLIYVTKCELCGKQLKELRLSK